jgi:hypothetical protein
MSDEPSPGVIELVVLLVITLIVVLVVEPRRK